ncbi:PadR family transcriptional regulator [Micrococcus endophyticus]|uniref:PadR family transcriptional regulator n=1 Tax=Micrococcus endophyticus TaxID=455343 RepID=UPI0037FAA284
MDEDQGKILATHRQELRRGTLVVACLLACRTPRYGYALLEHLADARLDAEANTLYPLLRRLGGQGLLQAEWNTDEPRPRKYYRTTPEGEAIVAELRDDWLRLTDSMTRLGKDPS